MISKPYPKYKPSEVEWLGDMPVHWNIALLKWLSVRYSGGTPDKTIQGYWDEGSIPWLNSGAVNDGYIVAPSTYITVEGFSNSSAKWIPKKSLVIALAGQGKTKGMVAQLGFEATCNQSMAAIIPNQRINARMLYWWLTKNYRNIRNLAGGEARDGLNLEMIGSIQCPLPPLPEQQAIATFLDRETGCIDTLITKKQKLIELLKEKCTVLISHAVTKGLDASVKMKPSGVEWLGDVPEHWKVSPVKYVCCFAYGDPLATENREDGKVGVFGSNGQIGTHVVANTTSPVIVIGRKGSFGKINFSNNPVFAIDTTYFIDRHFTAQNIEWLKYAFLPLKLDGYSKDSAVPGLAREDVYTHKMPLPPLSEQQAIATFLDRATSKIDSLVAKVETIIEKLKEYRMALISAAVTGKIDVREES